MRRGEATMQVRSRINGLVSAPPRLVMRRSKTEESSPQTDCQSRRPIARLPGQSPGVFRETVGGDVDRIHVSLQHFPPVVLWLGRNFIAVALARHAPKKGRGIP